MKLYLSSYKFPDNPESLPELFGVNKKVGLITNALDFSTDIPRRQNSEREQLDTLSRLGLEPELLDLRTFFNKQDELKEKVNTQGGVWVHGGNTFILRVAYMLSGFDRILSEFSKDNSKSNFVYAGFSAAGCVLQKSLKGIDFVDEPGITKDVYNIETIWEGVGIIDFAFVPHFDSDHPESEDTNTEIEFYKENKIEYRTLRDGEVLILNT